MLLPNPEVLVIAISILVIKVNCDGGHCQPDRYTQLQFPDGLLSDNSSLPKIFQTDVLLGFCNPSV
jgi:hypothetical protein